MILQSYCKNKMVHFWRHSVQMSKIVADDKRRPERPARRWSNEITKMCCKIWEVWQ